MSAVVMGTPGSEPKLLLNALKPMLGMKGDIKTPQEVARIVGMMKDAEKLVSRCIYLSILRATCEAAEVAVEKQEALARFLVGGGWGILNRWTNDFMKTENYSMLMELLDVLKILPVSVELLKQGNTGKVVKQLTKANNTGLKKSAIGLLRQWKEMIRGDNPDRVNGEKKSEDNAETSSIGPLPVKRQGSLDGREPPDKKPRTAGNSMRPAPKVKLIDPLPKSAMESGGFMDALNAATTTTSAAKKKRKLLPISKTHLPLDEILSNPDQEATTPPATILKDLTDQNASPANSPGAIRDEDTTNGSQVEDNNKKELLEVSKKNSPESALSLPVNKKSKKGRSIRWAPDENLVEISYFELDEEERASMHHSNFDTAKHNEALLERRTLASAKKFNEDTMIEKMAWYRPKICTAPPLSFELGSKSREKNVQMEREKKVLADIFLTKASLPDSPAEADIEVESGIRTEPIQIPHDEDGTIYPLSASQSQQSIKSTTVNRTSIDNKQPTKTIDTRLETQQTKGQVTSHVQNLLDKLMVNTKDSTNKKQEPMRSEFNDRSNNGGQDQRQKNFQQPTGNDGPMDGPSPNEGPFDGPPHHMNNFNNQQQMPPGGHHRGPPMQMMRPRGPPPPTGQPVPLLSMKVPPHPPNRGGFRGGPRGGPRGMGPRGPPDHFGGQPRFQGGNFDDGNMEGDYDMRDDEGMGNGPPMNGPRGPWMRPPFRGGRGGGGGGRGMMRGRGRGGGRDVCRHFLSNHGCRNGMNCNFIHPGVNAPY